MTGHQRTSFLSMTWAFIRLVWPVRPMGTPAVMTTVSPSFTKCSRTATWQAMDSIRSVEVTSPVSTGTTPQHIASWRRTFSCMVRATTGQAGRNREIYRAVLPEAVAVRIALAFRSLAVRVQVWVMASLMLGAFISSNS